jgi:prepilin-type N-terminal cleavage/methylation domain-containing protein
MKYFPVFGKNDRKCLSAVPDGGEKGESLVGAWKRKAAGQSGFTLLEMLAVVAVLACLLAASAVSVSAYTKKVRVTALDNSARAIYMAAQNRAVLLRGSGELEGLTIKADRSNQMEGAALGDGFATLYFLHLDDENIQKLLPTAAIDPALWEGDFYLVYEPYSGSVTDVFYGDETLPVGGDFPSFYETWRDKDRTQRGNSTPQIGYYGSELS